MLLICSCACVDIYIFGFFQCPNALNQDAHDICCSWSMMNMFHEKIWPHKKATNSTNSPHDLLLMFKFTLFLS